MRETVVPIIRITDIDRAVAWYARLGFRQVGEHRYRARCPAYVFVARGDVWLHLSQHEGDARPGSLVYCSSTTTSMRSRRSSIRTCTTTTGVATSSSAIRTATASASGGAPDAERRRAGLDRRGRPRAPAPFTPRDLVAVERRRRPHRAAPRRVPVAPPRRGRALPVLGRFVPHRARRTGRRRAPRGRHLRRARRRRASTRRRRRRRTR